MLPDTLVGPVWMRSDQQAQMMLSFGRPAHPPTPLPAVVHVIDNVLLPDRLPSTVQLATGAGPSTGTGSNQPTSPGIVSAASIEAETAANAAANASPAAAPAAAAAQYETVLEAAKDLNLTSLLGAVNVSFVVGGSAALRAAVQNGFNACGCGVHCAADLSCCLLAPYLPAHPTTAAVAGRRPDRPVWPGLCRHPVCPIQ